METDKLQGDLRRYDLKRYLVQRRVPTAMVERILVMVDDIVEAETADLRARLNEWCELAMKGEALREKMLLDSILGKHQVGTSP